MQQNTLNEIQQCLPEINPCKLELTSSSVEEDYRKKLNQITESIHSWAISVLDKAKLPAAPDKAKGLLKKYDADSDEGYALRSVIEIDACMASINNIDAQTSVLTAMKLFEALWRCAAAKIPQPSPQDDEQIDASKKESAEDIKLYQDTINELKKKYPHCNVNALRLLASTRLGVTKQQLDDLEISPQ